MINFVKRWSDAKRTSCLEKRNYGYNSRARAPLVKGKPELTWKPNRGKQIDNQKKHNSNKFSFFCSAVLRNQVLSGYSICVRWTKFARENPAKLNAKGI